MTAFGRRLTGVEVIRADGRADRVTARRADGTSTTWTCPTYGGTIPHDLVHLVVEAVFELDAGLWGCVAGGLAIEDVRARSAGSDGGELRTAEALSTVNFYDTALDGVQRCEAVLEACVALHAEPPAGLDPVRCDRATSILKPLKARCRAIAVGMEAHLDIFDALVGTSVAMRVVPARERDAW